MNALMTTMLPPPMTEPVSDVFAIANDELSIPTQLMGASLVSQGQEASRFLLALENNDLDRLRKMLESSIMIGNVWAARLQGGVK